MSDNKSHYQPPYPGTTGISDPFGGSGPQYPVHSEDVKSSPFGTSVPRTTAPPPPPEQAQPTPVIAPPPMPPTNVKPSEDIEDNKVLKGSLPGQVFHESFKFTEPPSTAAASSFTESTTGADIMENIKSMNTPSHFIRTSVKVLPSSATLLQKTHVPLGVVIRPMAPLSEDDPEIPLVNSGSESITRCTRCRTYINPFVTFDRGRRFWTCNICGVANEAPARYANLSPDDENLPPELKTGVVEHIASADYMVRPPQAPTIMFVIDVSVSAVNSGMLEVVCQTISDLIKQRALPGDSRTMVGIMTYDTSVHFYQTSGNNGNPNILVLSDLEDLFLPLPGGILVNVSESEAELLNLLSLLPSTWKNTTVSGSCLGSATRAAHFAMKHIGGKICLFTASPSYFGDFSLSANALSQAKPSTPNLQPVEKCKEYAIMVSMAQVSIEMFVCTPQSVNLSALHHLASVTAGNVHHMPFKTHVGNSKLAEELRRVITRETGWESVMRVRASKGWKITNWFGHCHIRGSDLMVLPNCHADQTFTLTFEHEDSVVVAKVAYFQCALLHTTSRGERRIRVSTFAIPVSDNASEVLLSVDPEAAVLTAAQLALSTAIEGKMSDARTQLQTLCGRISSAMSTLTSMQEVTSKIVMYVFGLLKSQCFSEANIPADVKVYHAMRMKSLPIKDLAVYCYPRMICVTDLASESGERGGSWLPPSLNLTHSRLTPDSAYLLENGECMVLWIGKSVSTQWLQSVFDVPSLESLNCDLAEAFMSSCKNPAAVRLASIVREIRSQRSPYMSLYVTRQGDESEARFFSFLVEDKTPGMMLTLNEFINSITLRVPFRFQLS
ncbi:vesicle transport protein [Babesia ovata]|uniref:Vesicle transport protein n=1 Tax=Babesia ovata TaxID=189622 RepID=A0A2H6KGH9_9APIC|nr:vesicle transport protein [Babesia ovata]GBE62098.1 vesicle transport protein [Babesia ovata]